MITVSRRLEFDAGHRLMRHESKCAFLHGHRYALEIEASGNLDALGRVIDFSVLKGRLGDWIDTNWDHNCILHHEDTALIALLSQQTKKPFILRSNPTAENMALYILNDICPTLFPGITIESITLYETPNCFTKVCRTP